MAQAPDAGQKFDLARIVPGDADFFIEVRGLERLQASFRSLGIWDVMRGIAETGGATTQPWQRRSEQLLGMTSEQMIERVLGRRAALFSKRSDDWQNGILVAELESRAGVRRLIRSWRGRPLADEGTVRRYRLPGGLLCAMFDRLLVIGPEDDPDGLLGRSILLLAGKRGPHLAGQSAFASLRTRLPADADAVIFARWPDNYRFAFADCERVMAACWFSPDETRCHIVGRLRHAVSTARKLDPATLDRIPPDAKAIWATAQLRPADESDTLDLSQGPSGFIASLRDALPGWFADTMRIDTLANGDLSVYLGDTDEGELRFPVLCIRMSSTEPANLRQALESVFSVFAGLIDIFSRPKDANAAITTIVRDDATDPPISHLPIGSLLARRKGAEILAPLELAWAATDDAVVVGTNRRFVRATVSGEPGERRSGRAAKRLIDALARDDGGRLMEAGYLNGRAIAGMIGSWLRHIETNYPYANDDGWWQIWAMMKLAEQSRLGVGLRDDADRPGRAIVSDIAPFSPSAGHLQLGDVIVAVGKTPLSRSKPSRSVAARYEARGRATHFELRIIRNKKRMNVSIPVPPVPEYRVQHFRPIAALRLLHTLLQCVDSAAYVRIAEDPAYLQLRINVRWTPDKKK